MTILAGIFSRFGNEPIENNWCESLKTLISRNAKDEIVSYKDDRCFLSKIDINAYGQPAFRIDPVGKSVCLLAGEPLIDFGKGNEGRTRKEDLELLHLSWNREDWGLLEKTRGVFCAVFYCVNPCKLTLIADKLGIRPLYYWEGEKYIIFSTALRVLEELVAVPKKMDLRGVIEIAGFGYPLSVRTPYIQISLLKAAEIVQISEGSISQQYYWRWDKLETSDQSEVDLLKETYERFDSAIAIRLRNDAATLGFLSGGLDSRCIIALLRSHDAVVYTFNFGFPGTQDQIFAAEFAKKVGTIHTEINNNRNSEIISQYTGMLAVAEAWSAARQINNWCVERPLLAWSGDGGSVGVGHVYLSKAVVTLIQGGKRDEAIDLYLKEMNIGLLNRLLKRDISHLISETLDEGIRQELEANECLDPARSFHLFLMFNDQRRHLSNHYENIDLHRLEVNLPFYDSYFLELILSKPIDLYLYHHFYVRWLKYFPDAVTSVAWQYYPGHEPCPIPIPAGLPYQWHYTSFRLKKSLKNKLLQQAYTMLKTNSFPYEIINRTYLRLATWAYHLGVGDYSYVIKTAKVYYKYWGLCNGKYELPSGR